MIRWAGDQTSFHDFIWGAKYRLSFAFVLTTARVFPIDAVNEVSMKEEGDPLPRSPSAETKRVVIVNDDFFPRGNRGNLGRSRSKRRFQSKLLEILQRAIRFSNI